MKKNDLLLYRLTLAQVNANDKNRQNEKNNKNRD
jgi:hypothetical protein